MQKKSLSTEATLNKEPEQGHLAEVNVRQILFSFSEDVTPMDSLTN